MKRSCNILAFVLLASTAILPSVLAAQESTGEARAASAGSKKRQPPLTEQQRRGEALFVQNCPLCHIPSKQKKELGIQGPMLQGVYGEGADEDALRERIEQGMPGRMPGFRYTLDSKQIDDVIAFLKSGAYLNTPGVAN